MVNLVPFVVSFPPGHAEVVRVLLAAKAQVSHSAVHGGGPPELKDAVDGCHVEVREQGGGRRFGVEMLGMDGMDGDGGLG